MEDRTTPPPPHFYLLMSTKGSFAPNKTLTIISRVTFKGMKMTVNVQTDLVLTEQERNMQLSFPKRASSVRLKHLTE